MGVQEREPATHKKKQIYSRINMNISACFLFLFLLSLSAFITWLVDLIVQVSFNIVNNF